MPLFNFKLHSLQETLPFGTEQDGYSLSWYGLTDGYFWFEVGSQCLLEYSKDASKEHPELSASLPYVDYYLAWLYQDLDEVLLYALSHIPADIFQRIATLETMFNFLSKQETWWQNSPEEETDEVSSNWNTYLLASFLSHRKLDLGYLLANPDVWFFRIKDEIIIRWKSDQKLETGTNLWESTQGEYRISIRQFTEEVIDFFDRLHQQMSYKVEQACQGWPFPKVKIDLELLKKEHFQHRLPEFEQIKSRARSQQSNQENWEEIRASIEMIEKGKYWI